MAIRARFVREMAEKVLRDSKISAPPVDLLTILHAHGIQYEEVDDFPDTVDALIIERGRETYAAVNSQQHPHRRRTRGQHRRTAIGRRLHPHEGPGRIGSRHVRGRTARAARNAQAPRSQGSSRTFANFPGERTSDRNRHQQELQSPI